LYTCKLVEPVWRYASPDFLHRRFGAGVTITERVIEWLAGRIEPHIVNRPAVNTNGMDRTVSMRNELGSKAKTLFRAVTKPVKLPIEVAIALNRPILKAMYKVHLGCSAVPLGERDAAACSAQIDRNTTNNVHGRLRRRPLSTVHSRQSTVHASL